MKKILKLILLIGVLSLTLTYLQKVDAATYNGKLYDVYHPNSGFSVFAAESTGYMDYNSWMIKSSIDNRIYYCIDPAIALGEAKEGSFNYITGKSNIIGKANITEDKYNKILLISYYGYGYKNANIDHTSKKWYGITQVMIWEIMRPDLTWTFKESRYSTPNKSLYTKEVNEINTLVKNHEKTASFTDKKLKLLLGESITLTDTNNVLAYFFRVNNPKNLTVKENNNKVTITANKVGKEAINYSKRTHTTEKFTLFTSTIYQDIISMGMPTLPYFQISVEVTGGTVNLQKVDSQTNKNESQGEATLKDAIYGVYDHNNNLVGEIITDEKGQGQIILDYGKYSIKEIKAPKGYKINSKVYEFEINENNNEINLTVADEVIRGQILLTKTQGGSGENFIPEIGAEFNVINAKGDIVNKIITNEKGLAKISLPYGTYIITQTKGTSGYIMAENTTITIDKEQIYELNIKNLKPSKLILTKIDLKTNNKLPNAVIEVYDENNTLIYTGKTDSNGQIHLENLKIGKYYILEKEAPKYYKLNKDKIYFEVLEHGKLIELTLTNSKNKGKLIFYKYDSNSNKKLANCYIEIYDTNNNQKIYEGSTNSNGQIIIENLDAGSYCIYEKISPKGYIKSKDKICFEMKNDNEIIKVEMSNDPILEVPDTMLMEFNTIKFLGILFIGLGVGFIIYEKISYKNAKK